MATCVGILVLAVESASTIFTRGQVRQISYDAPGHDADSRDATVVQDGDCFIYSSQARNNVSGLSYSDWRIWKTCGVFGATRTAPNNTLVSNPIQPEGTRYSFPQASSDGSARLPRASASACTPSSPIKG